MNTLGKDLSYLVSRFKIGKDGIQIMQIKNAKKTSINAQDQFS